MPGHKRSARFERLFSSGQDSSGAAAATTAGKGIARGCESTNGGDDHDDGDGASDGVNGNLDGPLVTGTHPNAGVGHRLLGTSAEADPQVVKQNLWLFIWLKMIGSFDSGAFSAALGAHNGIGDAWGLGLDAQGVLTSSVFLGNVFGCPLAGHLLSRYNQKRVLCGALVVHTIFTFAFAAIPSHELALVNRFFIGLTLSFIVVYTPVWVDEFAPKNRQSVWMASHNAGVPLGVMLGYIFALGPQIVFPSLGWNWAFFIKCLTMIPTIAYVARVDARTINAAKTAADNDRAEIGEGTAASASAFSAAGAGGRIRATRQQMTALVTSATSIVREEATRLLRTPLGDVLAVVFARLRYGLSLVGSCRMPPIFNVVYLCSVASLTSLYFVATGLQNFVTQYLQEPPFEASTATIMVGFSSAVVTAPVLGVIVGGLLLDRIGGYKHNLWSVTLFLFFWGSCAVIFSIVCIFATTTLSFLLVMSAVLFCGGALIPPGAGLTMSSLPEHLRPVGAALSQTVYNLFGNFSGPLVCGFVATVTRRLRYGIITLLLSSSLGVLPLFGILFVAWRDPSLSGKESSDGAVGMENGAAIDAVAVEEEEEMDSVIGEAPEGEVSSAKQ